MDWTPLFNAIIALMGVLITVYLIPLLKSKLSQQELEKVKAYVNDAVRAAELLITGTKQGQAKKEWVINYLKEHGIKVDEEQISALIESAVYELNKDILENAKKFMDLLIHKDIDLISKQCNIKISDFNMATCKLSCKSMKCCCKRKFKEEL